MWFIALYSHVLIKFENQTLLLTWSAADQGNGISISIIFTFSFYGNGEEIWEKKTLFRLCIQLICKQTTSRSYATYKIWPTIDHHDPNTCAVRPATSLLIRSHPTSSSFIQNSYTKIRWRASLFFMSCHTSEWSGQRWRGEKKEKSRSMIWLTRGFFFVCHNSSVPNNPNVCNDFNFIDYNEIWWRHRHIQMLVWLFCYVLISVKTASHCDCWVNDLLSLP